MPHLIRRGYGEFGHRIGIGPAKWPHHDFLFIHHGHVSVEFPELAKTVSLAGGQGVLIWPHTEFRGQACRGRVRASIQHFRVEGDGDGPFATLADQQRGFRVTHGDPSDWLKRCVDRLQRAEGPVRIWLLAVILAEGGLLAATGGLAGDTRIDLASLREWTRTQLAKSPRVPDLAARVGLSPGRLRPDHTRTLQPTQRRRERAPAHAERRRQRTLPGKEFAPSTPPDLLLKMGGNLGR
jgi:hypothetical protein